MENQPIGWFWSEIITVLAGSRVSWWALKQSKALVSSQLHFGHYSSQRSSSTLFCSPTWAALWIQGNPRTSGAARTDPGCTRIRWWSPGGNSSLKKWHRTVKWWTTESNFVWILASRAGDWLHPRLLTFSHRVAHDEVSSSREGVYSTGVHHHLVHLYLVVHGITGSHWVIVLVSTTRLVTLEKSFVIQCHMLMGANEFCFSFACTCNIKIFGFPTRLLHLSPLNMDVMSWMLILPS